MFWSVKGRAEHRAAVILLYYGFSLLGAEFVQNNSTLSQREAGTEITKGGLKKLSRSEPVFTKVKCSLSESVNMKLLY